MISQLSFAKDIPKKFEKNWKEKSVFFGVNQAWEYEKQSTTLLTYFARERFRQFKFDKFNKEQFQKDYLEVRSIGTKFIGIENWTILSIESESIGDKKLLVKIRGNYQKSEKKVLFNEWLLFEDNIYHQVSLIEDIDENVKYVDEDEIKDVFKGVLEI